MITAADVVNRSLQEIGAQATVTGVNPTFDGSAAGDAAGILYTPAVNFMLRGQDWEFAFNQAPLVLSGSAAPYPWAFEYVLPLDCQRIRQIRPATWDLMDPQAVRWTFLPGLVDSVERRLILTDVENAVLDYTTSNVTEDMWDPVFAEGVVRLLASELAMAVAGRPDFSAKLLEWSASIAGNAAGKDS